MDEKINEVIAEDVEPINFVVKGKGEIAYIPGRKAVVHRKSLSQRRVTEIGEVLNDRVPHNEVRLVPLERTMERIGIDQKAENSDQKEVNNRFMEETGLPDCRFTDVRSLALHGACELVSF